MAGRSSKTFVYAPEIQVLIATDSGVIDISADVVSGQVIRNINALSQFSCLLNNRNSKYTGVIKRMDRITVSFSRVGKWMQVFSGYLDSVPAITLYKSTCSIKASCTLKRLINTWWDPGLPESQQLLDQRVYQNGGTQKNGLEADTGIGRMLGEVLFKVGGWDKSQIKIQNIPTQFMDLALQVSVLEENPQAIQNLATILGVPGAVITSSTLDANVPTTGTRVLPPPSGGKYSVADLVTICRTAGFTGDALINAAALAKVNSNGDPTTYLDVGVGIIEAGLYKFVVGDKISLGDAQDPLKSSKILFTLTKKGKDFNTASANFDVSVYNYRTTSQAWKSAVAAAKTAVGKADTAIVTNAPAATSGTLNSPNDTTTTTTTVSAYNTNASQSYLQGIYGNSEAAVKANLVTINFQGHQVQVHKLAADAFKAVDKDLTALNNGYKINSIGTFEYRTMNNGTGTSTLSWHSYGIAMDINSETNGFTDAGIGDGSHDMPASWIAAFKAHGFVWGGDWNDFMHFQYQGGGTYTGITSTSLASGAPAGSLAGVGTSAAGTIGIGNPFDTNLFGYLFLGENVDATSVLLTNDKAPVNDTQLMATVQAIASASMRSFMSGPDGSFVAFYPDYFGISGAAPVLTIEDIELVNFSVDVSDDSLATDVFVAGGTYDAYNPSVSATEWVLTAGVVNIRQKGAMELLLGADITNDPNLSPAAIYARFGLRPLKAEYPTVSSGAMEYLQALALFQKSWSQQFSTNVEFTFMPEMYPGMRLLIKSHQITVFVESVTHSFSFDSGFTTTATISSPAATKGGIQGLGLGRL